MPSFRLPPPGEPGNPFSDELFQKEIAALVLPRCTIAGEDPKYGLRTARAHGYLHDVCRGRGRGRAFGASGCALCGGRSPTLPVVEVLPGGFVPRAASEPRDVEIPHLCHLCIHSEIAAADAALRETLADLDARGDAPIRPSGPSCRALRAGLSALLEAHLPHLEEGLSCAVCEGRERVLRGARIHLCLSCVAAARSAVADEAAAARRREDARIRKEYARLHARAEARLVAKGKRGRVTPEAQVPLPAEGRIGGWSPTDVSLLEGDEHVAQGRIDEVGEKLASSIEAHVIASLRGGEEKATGSRFIVECTSGLPQWTRRYLDRFRPSRAVAERMELAILVMSELLKAGYGYTHQVEDFEWQNATGYFTLFHDMADRL